MYSPDEGPRRTETSHFFYKIVGIKVSRAYFLTVCNIYMTWMEYIFTYKEEIPIYLNV